MIQVLNYFGMVAQTVKQRSEHAFIGIYDLGHFLGVIQSG